MRDRDNADKLVSKRVRHKAAETGFKRVNYGDGTIEAVAENRLTVKFETGEVRQFIYPDAFKQNLELLACGKAGQVLNEYVQGDIEDRDRELDTKRELLAKRVNHLTKKVEQHNYYAVKMPSLDLGYCCTQAKMRENVTNKHFSCVSGCKSCLVKGANVREADKNFKKKYTKLIQEFGLTGNCTFSLALVNNTIEIASRSTIHIGDVLILTYLPEVTDESTRIAFGFGVVKSVEKKASIFRVELDTEVTQILPQEDVGAKYWDVAVNVKKPTETVFTSGVMKLTDMQAIQLIKMLCAGSDDVLEQSLLSKLCYYIGVAEAEIKENSGCLIDSVSGDRAVVASIEEATEEDYLPEDDYSGNGSDMY